MKAVQLLQTKALDSCIPMSELYGYDLNDLEKYDTPKFDLMKL